MGFFFAAVAATDAAAVAATDAAAAAATDAAAAAGCLFLFLFATILF